MAGRKINISERTKIKDLIREYPESAKILYELGLDCLSCKGVEEETLKLAAISHGYRPGELVKMIEERLNRKKRK